VAIWRVRLAERSLVETRARAGAFRGLAFPGAGNRLDVQIDKQQVIELLRKEGKNEHVQKALDELPEKIDHEQHAHMLEKFGIDPGELAAKAARGIL
jgi:ribosomal protein L25 (general stress protein Ctc)